MLTWLCCEGPGAARPGVLVLLLPPHKWGFNYLARERWGFITIPPGNGGANGAPCCIFPLCHGRLITWWISLNRSIVKHATLRRLSPVCWEAWLTGADSQALWIEERRCVCVCLTILNITTGTTNGARKTTCTCCCPGVAQTHTSEAGEAAALQSPSRPSWAFQPTEVTEEKPEFFSIFYFFLVGLEEVDRATNCFHIQTVWGHGWADVPSTFAFFFVRV